VSRASCASTPTAIRSRIKSVGLVEAGPDRVAQAGRQTDALHPRDDPPRSLIGKSSIQYVNDEDKESRNRQQYRVFVDAPLNLAVHDRAKARAGLLR